jgi:hypothetical protein
MRDKGSLGNCSSLETWQLKVTCDPELDPETRKEVARKKKSRHCGTFGRLRQENDKFKASLCYLGRPCLRKKKCWDNCQMLNMAYILKYYTNVTFWNLTFSHNYVREYPYSQKIEIDWREKGNGVCGLSPNHLEKNIQRRKEKTQM